jgi:hypothetical protein
MLSEADREGAVLDSQRQDERALVFVICEHVKSLEAAPFVRLAQFHRAHPVDLAAVA